MSRARVLLDRVVVALLGLLLLGGGAAAAVWGAGLWPDAPDRVTLPYLAELAEQPWWPWLLAVGGPVLAATGIGAVVSHLVPARIRRVALPATTVPGRLRADLPAVAAAAATALAQRPEVQTAHGSVLRDRDRVVLDLVARVDASTDLAQVDAALRGVGEQLGTMLPAGAADLRLRLTVRRTSIENPRVT